MHVECGMLMKIIIVSATSNDMIDDHTLPGVDHSDCSNQALSGIDFKINGHVGNIVNLHSHYIAFSIIFVQVAEERALMFGADISHANANIG